LMTPSTESIFVAMCEPLESVVEGFPLIAAVYSHIPDSSPNPLASRGL